MNSDGERPPKIVVIDALNVCHGGVNGEGWDGRRLLSAIAVLESMGYGTIPVIGLWRLKQGKKMKTHGFSRIDKLRKRTAPYNLRTTQGSDDMLVLELAVKHTAWIITQDGFGEEREKYPRGISGTSWEEIDRLTVGTEWDGNWLNKGVHWNAQGTEFVWIDCPIPDAPPDFLIDEFEEERAWAMEAKHLLVKLHGSLESKAKEYEDEIKPLLKISAQLIGSFSTLDRGFPAKRIPTSNEMNDHYKLTDLRELCMERGIPKSGRKAEVIQRIIEFDEGNKGEALGNSEGDSVHDHSRKDKDELKEWAKKEYAKQTKAKTDKGTEKEAEPMIGSELEEIDKADFADALLSELANQSKWEVLTKPYGAMVAKRPKYHLKNLGIKPSEFISELSDTIELKTRKDGHLMIRRKRVHGGNNIE